MRLTTANGGESQLADRLTSPTLRARYTAAKADILELTRHTRPKSSDHRGHASMRQHPVRRKGNVW